MTREAKLMAGIILITVPTIQYGGYFLLTSLMSKNSGYMENPLRQNFFRAGHAHAGVIVIPRSSARCLQTQPRSPSPSSGSFELEYRSLQFSFRRASSFPCFPRPQLKPTERSPSSMLEQWFLQ
jgi:hypothetical protein